MAFSEAARRGNCFHAFSRLKPFCRFDHAGGRPAQGHARITPAFDVAADAPDGAVHVLDDVRAGVRAPKLRRQAETRDREDLIKTFQDAGCRTRRFAIEPASKVPDQLLGARRVTSSSACRSIFTRQSGKRSASKLPELI
jgi:hypothetical protein